MDLMSTLKPKKNIDNPKNAKNAKKVYGEITTPDKIVEAATVAPTIVKNLESGDVTEYDDIPAKLQDYESDAFKIIDIYSNCNRHILYNSQFKQLVNDYDIQKKFSSEAELVQREIRRNSILKQLEYLDKMYSSLNFEFKIELQTELNIEQIFIKDKLHFYNDIVMVPLEYNYIIDNILSRIHHDFSHVAFCNNHDKKRIILPTTTFNILTINKQFCNSCEFYSICDGK